jgi:ATP-dependent DNA ligase
MTSSITFPIAPQLARLERVLPTGEPWIYEAKWDGFRGILASPPRRTLQSRNGNDLSRWFPELVDAGTLLPAGTILDGEIVAVRNGGVSFEALQDRLAGRRDDPVSLVAFDLLAVGGEDLRPLPFLDRRRRLEELGLPAPIVLAVQTRDRDVAEMWLAQSWSRGLEGVVAKRASAPYRGGVRGWAKVKAFEAAEVVVGGYTGPPGDPRALLLGVFDRWDRLNYVGTTTWLADRPRRELTMALPHLGGGAGFTGIQPGQTRWERDRDVAWVPLDPRLACEVSVSRLDGFQIRHAARFVRWRPDKEPRDCTVASLARVGASQRAPLSEQAAEQPARPAPGRTSG